MQTIHVDLGARSYPIHIGADLLPRAGLVAEHLRSRRLVVVSNETVAPLYLASVRRAMEAAGVEVVPVILPDGEAYKNLDTLNRIFDALIDHHCERRDALAALGGGVVGDLTGFAAACWMRGVPFVQLPTTLLAQVDSSVGGKTGVNHPRGKNMIGAFWQPQVVVADTASLDTLPERELSAGLAEVIKYGLIRDEAFLAWLEENMAALRARDRDALVHAIRRSCEHKAEVVAADELEAGQRALLNLGHTFGHAVEAGMGYGRWLHGEAVAAGTMLAADLSRRLGWLEDADLERMAALFAAAGLPSRAPDLGVDRYLELMAGDKKVEDGRLRLVLLRRPGQAVVTAEVAPELLRATLSGPWVTAEGALPHAAPRGQTADGRNCSPVDGSQRAC